MRGKDEIIPWLQRLCPFLYNGAPAVGDLACIATVAVPLIDRNNMQEIACPPGTTLVTGWEETTYTRPGEKVLYGYCEDADGNRHPTQDLGYGALKFFPKYFLYSLGISFVLVLFIVIPLYFLIQFVRRRFFSKENAAIP